MNRKFIWLRLKLQDDWVAAEIEENDENEEVFVINKRQVPMSEIAELGERFLKED